VLSLPAERFLVLTPVGEPLVIDRRGETVRRWLAEGVVATARHGDVLLFAGAGRVWASDLNLVRRWEMAWPGEHPAIDCFVDGAFYWWAGGDEVRRCGPGGRGGLFARLDNRLIDAAMDRYEQARGGAIFRRDWGPFWRIAYDETRGLFFLASHLLPHLVLCMDRSGRSLWCECLGPGCCGGTPYALPNGLYVASGGCNGILSWFGADGDVLSQSLPHPGEGLATAFYNWLRVLPDGRALVNGGPGLVAYGPTGELVWKHECGYLEFHCDPELDALVGCFHQRADANGPTMTHLELLSGL
jgi:hypothetical protein